MCTRIDAAFRLVRDTGRRCVWPFVPAGFPSLEDTRRIVVALAGAGVSGFEIGFPYSDSIADGPVIQEAFSRALGRGLRVAEVFETVAALRAEVRQPLVAMVSASIVYRIGPEAFVGRAAEAGFDGLIVPDLSLEEAPELAALARSRGMRLALVVAPTTSAERQARIAAAASGFLYYLSTTGVTGERSRLAAGVAEHVAELRRVSGLPVLVGFGISTPEQVGEVCRIADGAIVGSAIVRRMIASVDRGVTGEPLARETAEFVGELMDSTR